MTVAPHAQPPSWLADYIKRGFQLVFYPPRQKGPTGKDAIGWVTKEYKPSDYQDGDNVGVKLGTEVEPGRYLIDIDFDWAGGFYLAKRLLPPAGFGFGRSGKITHAFFTVPQPVPSRAYADISGRTLVELRCRKVDGSVGLQTMLPPSIHPTGDVLEIKGNGPITHEPNAPRALLLYAIGCILLFHISDRGFVHAMRLGFAGFLLQIGLEVEEVIAIGEALAEATANSVADVSTVVRSTHGSMRAGNKVQGKTALIQYLGEDGKKICARIKEWMGGGDFIVNDKDQIVANHQENIRRAFKKLDVQLYYDSFIRREMIRWEEYSGPIEDEVRDRLWLEIDSQFHFRPEATFFDVVLKDTSRRDKVHPVLDYLDGLVWDGVPRIDEWLIKYGGAADSAYTRAVSRLPLIAAVRRVRNPGSEFHEMLILESPQGTLKSSAIRALCPKLDWFSDDLPLNVDAKETIERTTGKWLIEAAELAGMHRSQVEHLKSFLSRPSDGPARLAYARMPVERPRQFILIGTTNSHAYLKDTTGNRRYWPVRVDRFNIMGLSAVRDQLWAEAAAREKKGEPSRLDPQLYADADIQQQRRKIEDSWEAVLSSVFDPDKELRLTTPEVFERLGIPPSQQDPKQMERLSAVMQSLGFRRVSVRDRFKVVRKGWGRDPIQGTFKTE